MNKPKIWIMVGLSGSGKSTIAKQLAEENNAVIVSSDAIRGEICPGGVSDQSKNEEVFRIYHDRIRKLLEQKNNVIADATNITIKSRRAILDKINGLNVKHICYIVPKRYEDCLRDNVSREYPVPEEVIKKQMYRFQVPFTEEGYDDIKVHDFGYENDLDLLDKMIGFDQKNPHHTMDLSEHCINTALLFGKNFKYSAVWINGAFLHDIGKLMCQTFDENGIAHYYQHHCLGAYYVLSHLKWTDEINVLDTCFLINYHMMPFSWDSDKAKRKWKRIFGEYKYKLLLNFNECDKAR